MACKYLKKILTNEKYMGDALLQKTYTVDCLTKKRVANDGTVPQSYVNNDHEAIIPREPFARIQEEMKRRVNIRQGMDGKRRVYSSKYALSFVGIAAICTAEPIGTITVKSRLSGDVLQDWMLRERNVRQAESHQGSGNQYLRGANSGKGKSAVAAAYRAGAQITNERDGVTHDYTRKGGVVHTEILLPDNAPAEYADRATLWNAVEKIEKAKNAQLAREIEIALPVELTQEQNLSLVRKYVKQHFVAAGMCVDVCIHDTGGGNPHAHILLTMRPFEQGGIWGAK